MKIRTSNLPKDLIDVTKLGIEFYAKNYLTTAVRNRIEEIQVAFRKENSGLIAWADYEENERRLPVEFKIVYNNTLYRDIPIREYLITLFHELTHLRQYATGKLANRHGYDLWEGVRHEHEAQNYWEQPWEIEAQGMEQTAYQMFSQTYPALNLARYSPSYIGRSGSDWKPVKKHIVRKAAKSVT